MPTRQILLKAVGIIGFVLSAFGGFLLGIAPPAEADAWRAVGYSSFFVLVILLYISVLSRTRWRKSSRDRWLAVSALFFLIAVYSAVKYEDRLERLTFWYPPDHPRDRYVAGTVFTPLGQKYANLDPGKAVFEFGLENREELWTRDSILHSRHLLKVNYVVLVVSLAATIFCLTEGAMAKSTRR